MIAINNDLKGTRILIGNEKRNKINQCISLIPDFTEIQVPILQKEEVFTDKVGEENNNLMYKFTDNGGRKVCLTPELTTVVQKLALDRFKYEKDLKLFYVGECFRGEKPQAGRFRQFTQFGVEILNPTQDYTDYLIELALSFCKIFKTAEYSVSREVTRGLDYYKEGKGFEIVCEALGSSKQVCGGGTYNGGIGFAVGVDRLLTI